MLINSTWILSINRNISIVVWTILACIAAVTFILIVSLSEYVIPVIHLSTMVVIMMMMIIILILIIIDHSNN